MTNEPAALDARLLTDEELRRWLDFYARRLALVEDETQPELVESARAWYAYHAGVYAAEERQRERARKLGVPRRADTYPRDFLDRLKRAVNLDGQIEHEYGVALAPARRGVRKGRCPIHGGDSPDSLAVFIGDPADQWYYCYVCRATGDCYSLIMQRYGVGFTEAVGILAALHGEAPPSSKPPARRPGATYTGRRTA